MSEQALQVRQLCKTHPTQTPESHARQKPFPHGNFRVPTPVDWNTTRGRRPERKRDLSYSSHFNATVRTSYRFVCLGWIITEASNSLGRNSDQQIPWQISSHAQQMHGDASLELLQCTCSARRPHSDDLAHDCEDCNTTHVYVAPRSTCANSIGRIEKTFSHVELTHAGWKTRSALGPPHSQTLLRTDSQSTDKRGMPTLSCAVLRIRVNDLAKLPLQAAPLRYSPWP